MSAEPSPGAPASLAGLDALFAKMMPKLEASDIVFEFLEIMRRTPIMPFPFRPLQDILIRAAIEITLADVRAILELGPAYDLKPWERRLVRAMGRLADRIFLPNSPPAQACVRMGLPKNFLYQRN